MKASIDRLPCLRSTHTSLDYFSRIRPESMERFRERKTETPLPATLPLQSIAPFSGMVKWVGFFVHSCKGGGKAEIRVRLRQVAKKRFGAPVGSASKCVAPPSIECPFSGINPTTSGNMRRPAEGVAGEPTRKREGAKTVRGKSVLRMQVPTTK